MADETLPTEPVAKERKSLHVTTIVAKVTEVVLAVFIIGLVVDPLNSYHQRMYNRPRSKLDDVALIYTTVAGYLLINLLFIIGHALGDKIPKRMIIMFSVVGAIMHLISASVMVHSWRKAVGSYFDVQNNNIYSSKMYNDMMISASVFTFINAAVYAAEVFVTVKYS
ncbi:GSCOCG00002693001-RA-CDS [Cotesia congregata]|uniref:MARVEL domain-containing protein n=1 Tax=Cotesia congregata TaxID=51543 RepID=A0A8J2HG48_COTCN|nr:GSCOCG00002693001-RA-CDS [Cotesia congregata]CAG5093671.1 Protein of unknown function [Cotesia congregata]